MKSTPIIREQVENFFVRWSRATNTCGIYGLSHRLTKTAVDSLYTNIRKILQNRNEITLGIIADEIAFEREPFYEISSREKAFIKQLQTLGIKKIQFSKGLTKEEMGSLLEILTTKFQTSSPNEEVNKAMIKSKITHIRIGDIRIDEEELLDNNITDINAFTHKSFDNTLRFLKKTMTSWEKDASINHRALRKVVAGLVSSLLMNRNLLLMLSSIHLHDENRFIHNVTVCAFTMLQAEILGLSKSILMEVAPAALLHNIGVLVTQDNSIEGIACEKKPEDSFLHENREGAKLLLKTEGITALAPIAAYEYPMDYNMSGYPAKQYGSGLNLISMMIAIANEYDNQRRSASYYDNGGPENVYKSMSNQSGSRFHPDLLNNFFTALGVYPPGTLIELDNGEVGLVIQPSLLDKHRPQIEILYNEKGEKIPDPLIISLLEKDRKGRYLRSIRNSVAPWQGYEVPDKYRCN
jgi:HD-GYP domain-containing protein (c-di-GMP phosphodiesterase class II)